MSKSKIVLMVDPEREAAARFTEYVQSVAFHLTLSRGMIAILENLRDKECPYGKYSHFISHSKSLINRGLIIRVDGRNPYHRLTRIGEIVVNLLVECGMMTKAVGKPRAETK